MSDKLQAKIEAGLARAAAAKAAPVTASNSAPRKPGLSAESVEPNSNLVRAIEEGLARAAQSKGKV